MNGFFRTRANLVITAVVAVVVGLGLSAGYATVTKATSSPEFCAHACHEMERTVYAEYTQSKHFKNTSGTVVTCAQCHLPQGDMLRMMGHQISATSRLWGHYINRADKPGRFEARRADLAKQVLADFAATNARECKSCHVYANMVLQGQSLMARSDHAKAMKTDANCLECHQGVAHHRMDQSGGYDFP